MELLDIVDENGEPTGVVKERSLVHQDGDLHRTAHVWIIRDKADGGLEVLLQKRSQNKDSHPGCYDISSAGHIPAGDDYIESALRELEEELGIVAEEAELEFRESRRISYKAIFHGKPFRDNQLTHVFRLKRNDIEISKLTIQEEEVESVMWMDYEECLKAVENNTIPNCIVLEELKSIG